MTVVVIAVLLLLLANEIARCNRLEEQLADRYAHEAAAQAALYPAARRDVQATPITTGSTPARSRVDE